MKRRPFQGVAAIVRFNWPYYLTSCLLITLGIVAGPRLSDGGAMVSWGVTVLAAWWTVASLFVSWWVYDMSDLHRYSWLQRAIRKPAGVWINAHAGFDETTAALRERLPGEWIILDHHDPDRMHEPSIHRAKKRCPPLPGTRSAPFGRWPVDNAIANGVLGLLAIHELRTHPDRVKWFAEARRVLAAEGRVVMVEHVRDLANFIAFGPGFFHFHSVASWEFAWKEGGLTLADTFRISPWLRAFILTTA